MSEHTHLTVSTDHAVKGIDATLVENRHLRVVLLQGKGGDILEFRDKRTDIDVLWSTPHNWQPPSNSFVHIDSNTSWDTHYPGGWQQNLPVAGGARGEVSGVQYDQHGESALIPWEVTTVSESTTAVTSDL